MPEWWTYGLSDFLMFSPATYWRLVERYNHDVWPLQLLTIAAGVMLGWWAAARGPMAGKVVAAVLAPLWFWVGWAFHWQRYASINWGAEYVSAAFALQALMLVAAAFSRPRARPVGPLLRSGGLLLVALALLVYPLAALAQGRPWSHSEVFGIMPGPTAMGTLGLLLLSGATHWRWLSVIPALALVAELATRVAMQS